MWEQLLLYCGMSSNHCSPMKLSTGMYMNFFKWLDEAMNLIITLTYTYFFFCKLHQMDLASLCFWVWVLNQVKNGFYHLGNLYYWYLACFAQSSSKENENHIRIFFKKIHIFVRYFNICRVTYHAYGTQVEMSWVCITRRKHNFHSLLPEHQKCHRRNLWTLNCRRNFWV